MKKLNLVGFVSLFILVFITGCANTSNPSPDGIKTNTWYPVGNVLDNQTFEIIVNDKIEKVTFLSLDIPNEELSTQYQLPIHAFIEEKLKSSETVQLSFDENIRDEQGRLLASVKLNDGTNLNEQLLEFGYAKVLIREPNVLNENVYKQLEQLSKSNGYGIWAFDTESSNDDVVVAEKVFTGISLNVDKTQQTTSIQNFTQQVLDLENWVLVSVTGDETYLFEPVKLEPGEKLIIYSSATKPDITEKLLYWGQNGVWSRNELEVAELYNKKNELMAVWNE